MFLKISRGDCAVAPPSFGAGNDPLETKTHAKKLVQPRRSVMRNGFNIQHSFPFSKHVSFVNE